MMRTRIVETGVRGLKARASEIVREVRERRARYIITYRGRAVAILAPVDPAPEGERTLSPGAADAIWDELLRLGERIGQGWRIPQSSAKLLSKMRR